MENVSGSTSIEKADLENPWQTDFHGISICYNDRLVQLI